MYVRKSYEFSKLRIDFRNGLEALSGSKPHDYVIEHLYTFTGHGMGRDTTVLEIKIRSHKKTPLHFTNKKLMTAMDFRSVGKRYIQG